MNANKQKAIGFGLMVPGIALAIYLVINVQFWAIAVSCVVTGAMAAVGYHMVKGATVKEAVVDVINDVKK